MRKQLEANNWITAQKKISKGEVMSNLEINFNMMGRLSGKPTIELSCSLQPKHIILH